MGMGNWEWTGTGEWEWEWGVGRDFSKRGNAFQAVGQDKCSPTAAVFA
jgi:hypothetical protein